MVSTEEKKPELYIAIKVLWYKLKFSGKTISELNIVICSLNSDTIMGYIDDGEAMLWRKDGTALYDEKYDLKLRFWFSFVKGLFASFE